LIIVLSLKFDPSKEAFDKTWMSLDVMLFPGASLERLGRPTKPGVFHWLVQMQCPVKKGDLLGG